MEPTSRSRLLLFLSCRSCTPASNASSFGVGYNEARSLLADGGNGMFAVPAWMTFYHQIRALLHLADRNLADAQLLRAKQALPSFTDHEDGSNRLDQLMLDVAQKLKASSDMLQNMDSSSHCIAHNAQATLVRRIVAIKEVFAQKQVSYSDRSSNVQYLAPMTRLHSEGALSLDMVPDTQDVQERVYQITNMANSITNVATLFENTHLLVTAQGSILDRVDYNIEQAAAHLREAVRELDSAAGHQSSRKKGCMLLLVVVTLVLLVVLATRFAK